MSKLMFCKLQDERVGTEMSEHYHFQCGTNEEVSEVVARVNNIYAEAQHTAPNIFQTSIRSSPGQIYRIVELLQGISLNKTDLDAKGKAFENFLGVVFRGEMGQYFTDRHIEEEARSLLDSIDGYLLFTLGIQLPDLTVEKIFPVTARAVREGRFDPFFYLPKFDRVENSVERSKYSVVTFGEIAESITNGVEIRQYVDDGVPYLRVTELMKTELDLTNVKRIARPSTKIYDKVRLREGDLLISRSGSLGLVDVVTTELTNCIISSHIMRIRLKKDVEPFYLREFLRSTLGQQQIFRRNNGAVVPEINHSALASVKIVLPPHSRQQNIIAEIRPRREQGKALRAEAQEMVVRAKAKVERMILGEKD